MPSRSVSLPFTLAFISLFGFCSLSLADNTIFKLVAVSEENFAKPHDIVLSPGGKFLYVADNGNDRIAILDAFTLKIRAFLAEGEVAEPHDVVFDADNRLLVADTGNSRIAIYEINNNRSGQLVAELRDHIRRPEGVAVHPDGRVFATGAASNNLVVYHGGKIVAERSGFSSPHDVEFDRAGAIWVADASNDRMVQLNEKLEVTRILAGPDYSFNGPRYMDFDDANRMYVADKYSNAVKVIAEDGNLLKVLGQTKSGKRAGIFNRPEGVEIRGSDIWFSDTYNDRIVRYRINRNHPE